MSDSATVQNEASIIREFATHPGMKLVVEKLNGQLAANKMAWLKASNPEEAESVRQNSRAHAILMNILNGFLIRAQQDTSTNTNGPVQQ